MTQTTQQDIEETLRSTPIATSANTPTITPTITPSIVLMSNELEFCLDNVQASTILENNTTLALTPEVNQRDVVELNVSLHRSVQSLNEGLDTEVNKLRELTERHGGALYGGSSLLASVRDLEPQWYRTTSLSTACAKNLLNITSQQFIIGVRDEQAGFALYNFFRTIGPILVALSASSPFSYEEKTGSLRDTGFASRRMPQYAKVGTHLPQSMWYHTPQLHSLAEYELARSNTSSEIIRLANEGLLDANWPELTKTRQNSNGKYQYWPFTLLEPHQLYWSVRIRPDHRREQDHCPFSIEIRMADIPTTIQRMQMLNSVVFGAAQAITQGSHTDFPLQGSYEELFSAARSGFETRIRGTALREYASCLVELARKGLEHETTQLSRLDFADRVIAQGNDAMIIREQGYKTAAQLREYLIVRLRYGERPSSEL